MKSIPSRSVRPRHLLWLLIFLFPSFTHAAPPLVQILFEVPAGRAVEINLEDGSRFVGLITAVTADSVTLDIEEPEWAEPAATLAVDEIVRVRERRSNAGRGAGWGAVSGALVGGGFGFLSGLYLASTNDSRSSDAAPVLFGTVIGAGLGAAALSVVGLGAGAMTSSWRTIYGVEYTDRESLAGDDRAPSRLDIAGGVGLLERQGVEFRGFAGRFGLLKQVSGHLEMGPHFEYVHLGGTETRHENGATISVTSDPSFHASLGFKLNARRSGFGPYATTGFGWYWGDGGYVGGHLGAGVRFMNRKGSEFNLDGRYHFNITDIDKGADRGFWTIGAGFAFDL